MTSIETARRIVGLGRMLAGSLSTSERVRAMSEQRRLWEAQFRLSPYEEVLRVASEGVEGPVLH